ncbi:hypothetical protein ACMXYW_06565 [Neptuniibacter sp. QD48_55]|uniref:hypothetical protein n=1 Tax=Neptuniibacter sp. QD48_55 TaxID=3398212 RepID=UPI0039F4E9DD
MSVELHKSYLDFAIKRNLFHYAITGAILLFHLFKRKEIKGAEPLSPTIIAMASNWH